MKTHPVAAILTSAYLSAMLTSSLAPIRDNTIFAAAVDPMAAQKAFQGAVSGLDAAGWAAAVSGTPAPVPPVPQPVATTPAPKAGPLTTEEWIARLIKYTRTDPSVGSINPKLCAILGLCDGTKDMPLAMAKSESAGPERFFALPLDTESKDILILVLSPEVDYAYLTDKSAKLRAAAVSDRKGVRLIMNEKAEKPFQTVIEIFAKEAEGLPPSGTAVAGNS